MDCRVTPCKNVQTKMSCSVDKFSVLENCILLLGTLLQLNIQKKLIYLKMDPIILSNINDITLALEPV